MKFKILKSNIFSGKDSALIKLDKINVSFGGETILKDFSLNIKEGEFVTLLGPSGCGKTTTLRIIAGFLKPDSGNIFFKGKNINGVPAHKREVNTIFQKPGEETFI